MTPLHDLTLGQPLGDGPFHWVLFATFFIHFVFVLLTLGTAVLGVAFFLRERRGPPPFGQGWDRTMLGRFFVFKSLAIVWGVAPLLLVQAHQPVPFFSAVNLTAPLWLWLVPLLVGALLLLEGLAERGPVPTWGWAVAGVAGLALLAAVPGVFAAVVVTAENPGTWSRLAEGAGLPPPQLAHWALRLVHVVGAGVVVTATWQLLRLRDPDPRLGRSLRGWLLGGLAFQVVAGVALFASLPRGLPPLRVVLLILVGITAALGLAWRARGPHTLGRAGGVMALTLATVAAMLLARQTLQDAVLVPLDRTLEGRAPAWQARLAPHRGQALAAWKVTEQVVYEDGLTLYTRSCGFCHGAVANGAGSEASALRVPPEDLTALRATRATLRQIVREGVPGTAMPRFGMYLQGELDGIFDFLEEAGLAPAPEGLGPGGFTLAEKATADRVWRDRCAGCHGEDGRGTPLARGFVTPPPDLTRVSFSGPRAWQVVSEGYPGTLMRGWAGVLTEGERWALADRVQTLYRGPRERPVRP